MSGGGKFQGYQGAGGQPPRPMMSNWDNGSNMGSGGTGAWGGNYGNQTGQRQPGFVPGGPDDPANGGSGYMNSGRGPIPEGAIGWATSCFIDGVQVELVDGSEKNVSEINIGDEVKTDKGDGVVTKVYPSKAGGQKLYGFNDKEPFVTEAHPFMTQDGWKKISEVSKGDTLYRNGKGDVTVESITAKEIPEDTPVYNFHVDGHETYFADGYLVHNKTYAPGYEPGGENFVPGTGPQSGWTWPGGMPGDGWSPSYGYPNGGFGYNNRPPQPWRPPVQNPGMPPTNNTAKTGPTAWDDNENLGQAQRFANTGSFGRAKQQIVAGGGNWDDYRDRLRAGAGTSDTYGGAWDWGKASEDQVAQAQRFANQGQYGFAKGVMGDNWNKGMSQQFRAEQGAADPYVKGASMGFDWGSIGDKRLAQSKAFAQQGKFGRAKKMFTGGVAGKSQGTWDQNIARQMRAWHKGNK